MGSQSRGSPPPPGPAAPSPAAALPAPTGATGLTLAATASSALVCQGGKALLVHKAWPLISTINLCDVYGYLRGDGARLQLLLIWLAVTFLLHMGKSTYSELLTRNRYVYCRLWNQALSIWLTG